MIAHLELLRPLFQRGICDMLLVTTAAGSAVVDPADIETIESEDGPIHVFGALGTLMEQEILLSQFDEATCESTLITVMGTVTFMPLLPGATVLTQ